MPTRVALLRAVNVGGTGKLPMADLGAMCAEAGWSNIQTVGASGNVLFDTGDEPAAVKAALERRLLDYAGKPVGVLVRTAAEMAAVLAANPFPEAPPSQTMALFLDGPPPADTPRTLKGLADEQVRLGAREIYIHYPGGAGRSKLVIPAAKAGTARNMNTVAKLAALAAQRPA